MKKNKLSNSNFFEQNGYFIVNQAFNRKELNVIRKKILLKLNQIGKKNKLFFSNLKNLHKEKIEKKKYFELMNSQTRFISVNKNEIQKIEKNKKIQGILDNYWLHNKFRIYWVGDPKKKEVKLNKIGFRIARPKIIGDAAKSHVDNYNNDMKSFLTLWVPLVGFTKKYVLNVYPGTHKIDHRRKIIKKRKFISKIFSKQYLTRFKSKRFSLNLGDGILFHPNLIHGSSFNFGSFTRASVEFRMFNGKKFSLNKTFEKNFNQ